MRRALVILVLGACCGAAGAGDVQFDSAGPIGIGYVGLYCGLTDLSGNWYCAQDWLYGEPYTTDLAVADTGASASLLGRSSQDAYSAYQPPGIPLQPYPSVHFTDVGFGGTADFAVTQPLRLMLAGQKAGDPDPENHSVYAAYGPVGRTPPTLTMAASLSVIGGGEIDVDVIGMSVMQGRVLHVDPHELQFLRWTWLTMAGALDDPPPSPTPYTVYVPLTMYNFFSTPQCVDVGENPMLTIRARKDPGGAYAASSALLDTGSQFNVVSETFATQIGINLSDPPDLTVPVGGVGPGSSERPGYYVDSIALDLGNGREGDKFVIGNSAVVVIPDADMPEGLNAILGTAPFSSSIELVETTLREWYMDTRDRDHSWLVLVLAYLTGDADGDGAVAFADYQILEQHFGMTTGATWGDGDFDGDGAVTFADYQILERHFGQSIPEPAGLLLGLYGLPLLRRRRA